MKFREMYFFDMCLIYCGSLESVATNLGCELIDKQKVDVVNKDATYYNENRELITDYCIHDCKILM